MQTFSFYFTQIYSKCIRNVTYGIVSHRIDKTPTYNQIVCTLLIIDHITNMCHVQVFSIRAHMCIYTLL